MGIGQNARKGHIQEGKDVSPIIAGDLKAARNRQDSLTDNHEIQIAKRIQKRSTASERSARTLLEGLNMLVVPIIYISKTDTFLPTLTLQLRRVRQEYICHLVV